MMKKPFAIFLVPLLAMALAACSLLPHPAAAGEQGRHNEGSGCAANATEPAGMAKRKIAIDPGHGGRDLGAVGTETGALEADLNLQLANILAQLFRDNGIEVLLTRESAEVDYSGQAQTEKLKDMNNRARTVRDFKPDALVSIHMNTFTERSVRGAEAFWQQGSEPGCALAQCIQDELNKAVNTAKPRKAHSGDFYILQTVETPSVIVECGYLSNAEEEKLLQDPAHQQALAECIYQGICGYFGVAASPNTSR